MTSWQDEPFRERSDGGAARPGSRRAAREAERRAETMLEKPPHPSGVVDFEGRDFGAHDFSGDFAPDQEFNVGDTQDIWRALSRGGQPQRPATAPQAAQRPGAAPDPATTAPDGSAMSGELLDRVRDAVLRRAPEAPAPTVRMPQAPAPERRPQPEQAAPQTYDRRTLQPRPADDGASRRQRRMRETADLREDGLPAELFVDRGPVATPAPQPAGFDGYDYEDDGYYDEPYAPEPTVVIPAVPAARTSGAVSLPQGWAEPAGDDRLTFSSPVEQIAAQAPVHGHDPYAADDADPAFLAPDDRWDDEDDDEWEAAPPPARATASAPVFQNPQLGPPSEATDLAGFEALIRKARQQPAPQAPKPAAFAWADEEEVQEGFTGLLSRQVQGSHGSANALILPVDPQQVDVTQAVNGDGDIFRTGTMKLSRSLSTTGMSDDAHDAAELDRMADTDTGYDEPSAGVEPVRASRAVSGTGPSRAIVTGRRTRGNLLPTVLAVVAGAMAVGVVTLLVGSWLFKIF